MLFSTPPSLCALLLTLLLLAAHAPAAALSIPPALKPKAPPRVQSLRAPSTHDSWTNAQRLAVGLPPRAPRAQKRAPSSTSTNTNTNTGHLEPAPVRRSAPSPSASPFAYAKTRPLVETAYAGHIVARYTGADAAVAGSVRASASGVTLGGDADGARITFATAGPRALFSISALGAVSDASAQGTETETTSTFIGASGTAALGAGSPSAVLLNSVAQTSAHARPATTGSESAIWLFDASSGALTAHWVNPDGSHPRTRVAARARDGALVLTGDVAAYNAAAPGAGDVLREVTLQFISE